MAVVAPEATQRKSSTFVALAYVFCALLACADPTPKRPQPCAVATTAAVFPDSQDLLAARRARAAGRSPAPYLARAFTVTPADRCELLSVPDCDGERAMAQVRFPDYSGAYGWLAPGAITPNPCER